MNTECLVILSPHKPFKNLAEKILWNLQLQLNCYKFDVVQDVSINYSLGSWNYKAYFRN